MMHIFSSLFFSSLMHAYFLYNTLSLHLRACLSVCGIVWPIIGISPTQLRDNIVDRKSLGGGVDYSEDLEPLIIDACTVPVCVYYKRNILAIY